MTAIQPILLRAGQVALLLSISEQTVRNRVNAGRLPKPIKWEGVTVWRRKDLEDFVDGLAG
ncbi:MAG: helix-turn-helix transcriptional regulator [Pelagimonas sp.]|uniref:helix-turn-helix transcriptional regulator n=1 Tax=Pelagimonas sp. TaxID=2073170 RepID=UPI003D6A9562